MKKIKVPELSKKDWKDLLSSALFHMNSIEKRILIENLYCKNKIKTIKQSPICDDFINIEME